MSLIDEIRAIAAQKDTFNPDLVGATRLPTFGSQVELPSRPSGSGGVLRPPTPTARPGGSDVLAETMAEIRASRENAGTLDGGDGGDGSLAGRAFSKLIDTVDLTRRYPAALLKETLDVVGEPLAKGIEDVLAPVGLASRTDFDDPDYKNPYDGDFSWADIKKNVDEHKGFGEIVQAATEADGTDRPLWMRQVAGIAGDLAVDPLLYTRFGTVAKGGAKLGTVDAALKSGERLGLAKAIGREATQNQAVKLPAQAAADQLATRALIGKAGTHGRSAFTRKSLAEMGVTDNLLGELGVQSRLGYSFGGKTYRVAIAGSRRLAELSESGKGAFKHWLSKTDRAGKFRARMAADDATFGALEAAAKEAIILGSSTAPEAAVALSNVHLAKMGSHFWADNAAKRSTTSMRWLGKKNRKYDSGEIIDLVERSRLDPSVLDGSVAGRRAAQVNAWFDSAGASLKDAGIDFNLRSGYINHVPTKAALELFQAGEERLSGIVKLVNAPDQAFVKARTLEAGDDFFGTILTESDLTIKRLNEISMEAVNIKVLEDDLPGLLGSYMKAGQLQLLKDGIANKNIADNVLGSAPFKVDKASLEAAELANLVASANLRKKALKKAAKDARGGRDAARTMLREIDVTIKESAEKIAQLESSVNVLQGQLGAYESALSLFRAMKSSKGKGAKRTASIKIKQLEADIVAAQEKISFTNGKLERARKVESKADWAAAREEAEKAHTIFQQNLDEAQKARDAMDEMFPVPGTKETVSTLAQAEKGVRETRAQFLSKFEAHTDAANAHVWLMMDTETARTRLMNANDLYRKGAKFADGAKVGKKGDLAGKQEANDLLSEQMDVMLKAYKDLGEDKSFDLIRNMEAQALSYDAATFNMKVSAQEVGDGIVRSLTDPKFAEHMMRVTDDGYRMIDDTLQAPDWYADALKRQIDLTDPAQAKELAKVIRGYDQALNLWKSYATASPGFVARNLYSGMFGMYLDNVTVRNFSKFQRYLKEYEGWLTSESRGHLGGVQAANKWAKKHGFEDDIPNLQGALEAAAGSGWGLQAQEVTQNLAGGKFNANPFSTDFLPTKWIRERSGNAEARMRGGHAYDVMVKGGDKVTALEHIERFHFNYRDISGFDRGAKRVSPFWMFYSRNMALQASVWSHSPGKLNRSYFNIKRNLELGSEDDQVTPGYFEEMGAIKTPWGERDGGTVYFTPDLPSLRFRQDLAAITGTGPDGFDPLRMLSDTSPAIKVPVELATNKKLFTDVPFKNRLYDYDSDGEAYARQAPRPYQLPVLKNLLGALPGAQVTDGTLLMQDNVQSALDDFFPGASRVGRLAPNNPKDKERQLDRLVSFIGVPAKVNTAGMIEGELYGRSLDSNRMNREEQVQQLLQELLQK